jgi:hypothetical protein
MVMTLTNGVEAMNIVTNIRTVFTMALRTMTGTSKRMIASDAATARAGPRTKALEMLML